MTDAERLEVLGEKVKKFGELAKSKGFHKEEIIKPACISVSYTHSEPTRLTLISKAGFSL